MTHPHAFSELCRVCRIPRNNCVHGKIFECPEPYIETDIPILHSSMEVGNDDSSSSSSDGGWVCAYCETRMRDFCSCYTCDICYQNGALCNCNVVSNDGLLNPFDE